MKIVKYIEDIIIMGFLSKIFGQKEEKGIQIIESEMEKLRKKTNAEMIVIFGIGGRLKGLPLIYSSDDENEVKRFSARLYEVIDPINKISGYRIVRDFIVNYNDSILFFKQIMNNIGYFTIFGNQNDLLVLKKWIYSKEKDLKELLHE
jgi:hypothetical protein